MRAKPQPPSATWNFSSTLSSGLYTTTFRPYLFSLHANPATRLMNCYCSSLDTHESCLPIPACRPSALVCLDRGNTALALRDPWGQAALQAMERRSRMMFGPSNRWHLQIGA